jgi:hypothetical protein
MKILILASNYPSEDRLYDSPFIHSRCLEYKKQLHEVKVLSFSSEDSYIFEDIEVFSEDTLSQKYNPDLIMSHAPNKENHLRLINKRFSKLPLIMFFHGHEIMNINKHYPKLLNYTKLKSFKLFIKDIIKLTGIKFFLLKRLKQKNIHIIFVSEWMKQIAFLDLKLTKNETKLFSLKSTVIANSANSVFLNNSFQHNNKKIADFITIRPFDNPKYGIDIVYKIAKDNPQFTFHVYGEGNFFKTRIILDNLKVFKRFILQKEIPKLLNKYKYALMPTRLDSQGVMMCEIASYGMPLITSNIPICREMLCGFNVFYIENNMENIQNINEIIDEIKSVKIIKIDKKRFNALYLVDRELEIANKITN